VPATIPENRGHGIDRAIFVVGQDIQRIQIPYLVRCRSLDIFVSRPFNFIHNRVIGRKAALQVKFPIFGSILPPRIPRRIDELIREGVKVPTVKSRIPIGQIEAGIPEISPSKMDGEHSFVHVPGGLRRWGGTSGLKQVFVPVDCGLDDR